MGVPRKRVLWGLIKFEMPGINTPPHTHTPDLPAWGQALEPEVHPTAWRFTVLLQGRENPLCSLPSDQGTLERSSLGPWRDSE